MNVFSTELRVSRVTQSPFPTYSSLGPTLDMCPWPLRSILWWSLHPCLQRWGFTQGDIPKSCFSNLYMYCLKANKVRIESHPLTIKPIHLHFMDRETEHLWHYWWSCWQQSSSDINTPMEDSSEYRGCEDVIVWTKPTHGKFPQPGYSHQSKQQSPRGWINKENLPDLQRTPHPPGPYP